MHCRVNSYPAAKIVSAKFLICYKLLGTVKTAICDLQLDLDKKVQYDRGLLNTVFAYVKGFGQTKIWLHMTEGRLIQGVAKAVSTVLQS